MLQARWDRYTASDPFRQAYAWMAAQMEQRHLPCKGCAPVWVWHSCQGYGRPPTLGDARALLSDLELEQGIATIQLKCPAEAVLLSRYSVWNTILDMFIDREAPETITDRLVAELFAVSEKAVSGTDSVQGSLPVLYPAESGLRKTARVKSSDDYSGIYNLIDIY